MPLGGSAPSHFLSILGPVKMNGMEGGEFHRARLCSFNGGKEQGFVKAPLTILLPSWSLFTMAGELQEGKSKVGRFHGGGTQLDFMKASLLFLFSVSERGGGGGHRALLCSSN